MKSLTAITVFLFILLLNPMLLYSQSKKQTQDKFLKYVSVEVGYGKTEPEILNKDFTSNGFRPDGANAFYAGISFKVPYIVPGLYYYENKFSILKYNNNHTLEVYPTKNSYLMLNILYDLLEINVNKIFFVNLKIGGNASLLLSDTKESIYTTIENFKNKSFAFGLNGKFEGTFNIQDIGIMAGIDYNYSGFSNPIFFYPEDNQTYSNLGLSSFRFYGGIRKYF